MLGFVQQSWSWITSWFSSVQLSQQGGERRSAESKCVGFDNVFLCYPNNSETESETEVFSYLSDCVLHGLEGAQRCPLNQENTGQEENCEKCLKYNAAVRKKGVITAGDFIDYVCNHSNLNNNGAMSRWHSGNENREVSELQFVYGHESNASES